MLQTAHYTGPATVLSTAHDGRLRLRLPSGLQGEARLALAVPFEPAIDDELLVTGPEPEELYVIGVLRSSRPLRLASHGDLNLSARGKVILEGAQGIQLKSDDTIETNAPFVKLEAGKLEINAGRLLQSFRSVYTWVSGLFQLKTKRTRLVSDQATYVKAETLNALADGDVNIDGNSINLG